MISAPLHARVNGAGPTGALTALALARAGWRVSLHDPQPPQTLRSRERAYAFTHSSQSLLAGLGLAEALAPHLVPFRSLRLRDEASGGRAHFVADDLASAASSSAASSSAAPSSPTASAVGWIGRHGPLMALLLERLGEEPGVTLHLGEEMNGGWPDRCPDGALADLVVAADGPESPTREAAGIGLWRRPYRQACLTVQVRLRGSDDDEAWELLRSEGPFAVLPLGNGVFQLVWSAPAGRCRQLERLDPAAFLDALAGALPDRLQPDQLLDTPRAFPLSLQLARRLHRGRLVLVGESAHRCHPVGGQGLNLCWRDVEVLQRLAARAAAGRLDPDRIGAAYARRRWPDLLAILLATELMVSLFSNRNRLLLPPRRLAVNLLARRRLLRRLSLAVMTHGFTPRRPWRRALALPE